MTRILKNQRWRCSACNAVTLEPELLIAPSPFDTTDILSACPKCKQCDEGFDLLCDEAGCDAVVAGGWATGNDADEFGGYKNTCSTHYVKGA